MYELPSDFDLATFVGTEVNTIMIGFYQLWIDFIPEDAWQPDGLISISGAWELRLGDELVDASMELTKEGNERRESYRIHRLLGRVVTGWAPDPPWGFRLDFAGGYSLRVVDETEGHYEYLAVTLPGDQDVRWYL